jgi:hypothetical protein
MDDLEALKRQMMDDSSSCAGSDFEPPQMYGRAQAISKPVFNQNLDKPSYYTSPMKMSMMKPPPSAGGKSVTYDTITRPMY